MSTDERKERDRSREREKERESRGEKDDPHLGSAISPKGSSTSTQVVKSRSSSHSSSPIVSIPTTSSFPTPTLSLSSSSSSSPIPSTPTTIPSPSTRYKSSTPTSSSVSGPKRMPKKASSGSSRLPSLPSTNPSSVEPPEEGASPEDNIVVVKMNPPSDQSKKNKKNRTKKLFEFLGDENSLQPLLKSVPHIQVVKPNPTMNYDMYSISGPRDKDEKPNPGVTQTDFEQSILKFAHARSTINSKMNMQQPDFGWADCYSVSMYEKRLLGMVTDGGQPSEQAALISRIANDSFAKYLFKHINEMFDTVEIGILLLNGLRKAYARILANMELLENCPTSVCGGIVVELSEPLSKEKEAQWAYVGIKIGTSRAFHFSPKTRKFSEIDAEALPLDITKDKDHLPLDLTSVSLNFMRCEEGDIIILTSDGVVFDGDIDRTSTLETGNSSGGFNGGSLTPNFGSSEIMDGKKVRRSNSRSLNDLLNQEGDIPPDQFTPQFIGNLVISNAQRTAEKLNQKFSRPDFCTAVSFIITGQKMKTKLPIPIELLEPKKLLKKVTEFLRDDDWSYLEKLLSDLPRCGVKKFRHMINADICTIHGPSPSDDTTKYIGDYACAKAFSTYPVLSSGNNRWEPNCDYFTVKVLKGRTIGVVTDGCSWGEAALEASVKANLGFTECLSETHAQISNTLEAGIHLLNALRKAHKSIVHKKDKKEKGIYPKGTTTIMGGMLMQLSPNESDWCFIYVSLGECRGYHFSSKKNQVTQLGKRKIQDDSNDPGGRLGPHVADGGPDLRNLELNSMPCSEGDLIFLMTDGVYENLDPQFLGLLPCDTGLGDLTDWANVPKEEGAEAKQRCISKKLEGFIVKKTNDTMNPMIPKEILDSLVEHTFKVTELRRQMMSEAMGRRSSVDYVAYPGKIDHATCLCFQVTQASKHLTDKSTLPQLVEKFEIEKDMMRHLLTGSERFLKICGAPLIQNLLRNIPKLSLQKTKDFTEVGHICGPDPTDGESKETELSIGPFVNAQCVSGYPLLPGRGKKEGDPICDYFSVKLLKRRAIVALSDGCNWGTKPMEASQKANSTFVEFMMRMQPAITNTTEAAIALLTALRKGHRAIIKDKKDLWEAGTTTLVGGLLLQLLTETAESSPECNQWGFLCVGVGDCKVFHYKAKEMRFYDITANNRKIVKDATDPGGRLGPHVGKEGLPDLRNLELNYTQCQEGDFIIVMSDGIHDNLDPELLGKMPQDFGSSAPDWKSLSEDEIAAFKTSYMADLMTQIISPATTDPLTPKHITNTLINHCKQVTEPSRDFLISHRNVKLPKDYVKFPGKMDHTTLFCLQVPKTDKTQKTSGVFQLAQASDASRSDHRPIVPSSLKDIVKKLPTGVK